MKWLSRLELKYGRYAVRNLTSYIIGLNIGVFFLAALMSPGALLFIRSDVLRGQIWRVISFIFVPYRDLFWFIIEMYFLYFIGSALENNWGRFKFNVFYLCGALGTIIAAFITGLGYTGLFINLSIVLAFATIFPDQEFMLFFILPVKAKYIGLLDAFFILYMLAMAIRAGQWPAIAAIIASIVNYLIFFGGDIISWIKLRKQVNSNRRRFFDQVRPYDRNRKY